MIWEGAIRLPLTPRADGRWVEQEQSYELVSSEEAPIHVERSSWIEQTATGSLGTRLPLTFELEAGAGVDSVGSGA
jgi:hypothetical protein